MRLPDMDFDPREGCDVFLGRAAKTWKPLFREKARVSREPALEVVDRRMRASGAGVGGTDTAAEQPRAVDAGIDLRRRQRGVAEQVLDGPQIAPSSQKMGGEGMAKRVRRRSLGQAERAAHSLHRQLHDARRAAGRLSRR